MNGKQKENLCEPVYKHLIQMLMNMELKPGDKIPESKIAEKMSVSRAPIREALRKLSNDGVVNIYPNRFAEVISVDRNFIINVGQARITLDTMFMKLVVYRGSNADFMNLKRIATACTEYAKNGDLKESIASDIMFHDTLAQISANPLLMDVQKSMSIKLQLLMAWKYIESDKIFERSMDHHKTLECLIARDEAGAVKAAVSHLVDFYSLDDDFPKGFFFPVSNVEG